MDQKINLDNYCAPVGVRHDTADNKYGFQGMDHFALETRDIIRMERFMCEVLGGEPYYYTGFSDEDKKRGRIPHIFVRIGNVLMQCAEPRNGQFTIVKDDPNIAPHSAFGMSAADLERNVARLRALGVPVAGPYRHHPIDIVSAYFQSPEGHKLELCTWEPYAAEAKMIGDPGVKGVDWPGLAHNWPTTR